MSAPANPRRRDFLFLSASIGWCALASPQSLAKGLKHLGFGSDEEYTGPLVSKVDELLGQLDRREITAEVFVSELGKRYDEMDLLAEFERWIHAVHAENEMRSLLNRKVRDHGHSMALFFVGPRAAHPPHAHHDLMSSQCVLKGRVHLRQYDRVARIDEKHLTLRPTKDMVLRPGGHILMTELKDNVHWFGTNEQPALILNLNISGALQPTFDPMGSREKTRYYVDPTSEERSGPLIVAREIPRAEAHERFSKRPLSDFNRVLG